MFTFVYKNMKKNKTEEFM